jgi:hypothetical protein
MLCPTCHGQRFLFINDQLAPCPECGGYGEVHCCDGLQEQPEPIEPPPENPKSESRSSKQIRNPKSK